MKHRAILAFPFALVLAAACGTEEAASPSVFAVGEPIGAPTSASIGPGGGELASSDGSFVLTVPAGAVEDDTVFSVQEITRTLPHGGGRAFRLGPEGQTFAAPVRLTFALGAGVAGALVAHQDDEGHFVVVPPSESEVDAEAGTVSVESTHFSDWTTTYDAILVPEATSVEVGESVGLDVKSCRFTEHTGGAEIVTIMESCAPFADAELALFEHASVNGVEGGNAAVGTITAAGDHLTYTAPSALPSVNPVAISVDVVYPGGWVERFVAVANVTVTDGAAFTGTAHQDQGAIQVHANVSWIDGQDHGGSVEYASSGTVTYGFGPCTVSPSSAAISPDDGYLVVDFSGSPPRYYGAGTTSWNATIQCPDQAPYSTEVGAVWLQVTTPTDASDDGKTLTGAQSFWSWTFTAP